MAELYVVPFTKRLLVAKGMPDAKSYITGTLAYVRDIHQGDILNGKHSYVLAHPYLGNSVVEITDDAKEELCL